MEIYILLDESIKPPATFNNCLAPRLSYVGNKVRVNFDGSCSKQDKIRFTHGSTTNIYIVHEIRFWPFRQGDFTLGNALPGAVELVKNAGKSKYKYSGYGIGFDNHITFSMPVGRFDKTVIFFKLIWVLLCILIRRKKIF